MTERRTAYVTAPTADDLRRILALLIKADDLVEQARAMLPSGTANPDLYQLSCHILDQRHARAHIQGMLWKMEEK